jgi:hypothetical protein
VTALCYAKSESITKIVNKADYFRTLYYQIYVVARALSIGFDSQRLFKVPPVMGNHLKWHLSVLQVK